MMRWWWCCYVVGVVGVVYVQASRRVGEEQIVVYGRGEDRSLEEWRSALSALISDLQADSNVTACGDTALICVKNGLCNKEVFHFPHNGTGCSLLIYHQPSETSGDRSLSPVASTTTYLDGDTSSPNARDVDPLDIRGPTTPLSDNLPTSVYVVSKPTTAEVWGFGMLSVGIISLSGLFGALFWPLMKTDFYAQMMWILIGLAVGSLTASATFQLIPEGFKLKGCNEDYLATAVFMWLSFWALYMFEALSKIFLHSQDEDSSSKNAASPTHQIQMSELAKVDEKLPFGRHEVDGLLEIKNGLKPEAKDMPLYMSQGSIHAMTMKKASSKHHHSHGGNELPGKMAPVAWMIIIGDGIHNFIDGMSIGAGFSSSIAVGTSISIAIACEEFPHELGDFAILINSGMSVKKALFYNFLSACTAFAGLVLGILLGEISSTYIFAFAGGLFLYIALTDLMPELNDMIATGLETSRKTALFVLLLQNVGIFTGASILYLVTRIPIDVTPI